MGDNQFLTFREIQLAHEFDVSHPTTPHVACVLLLLSQGLNVGLLEGLHELKGKGKYAQSVDSAVSSLKINILCNSD